MNKYNLIRKFKRSYNTTPTAYQMQLRIDYAKHLLMASEKAIDVSLMSGFYDQAHFTREFKKATGITPTAYCNSIESDESISYKL